MENGRELMEYLEHVTCEEECDISCEDAEIFKDEEGWKLMLCGFMEPWPLGRTVEEAKKSIKDYASEGFGLT